MEPPLPAKLGSPALPPSPPAFGVPPVPPVPPVVEELAVAVAVLPLSEHELREKTVRRRGHRRSARNLDFIIMSTRTEWWRVEPNGKCIDVLSGQQAGGSLQGPLRLFIFFTLERGSVGRHRGGSEAQPQAECRPHERAVRVFAKVNIT